MVDTAETLARAINALHERPKAERQFSVMEKGYKGERLVYETDDSQAAQRVAGQHPARRIVRNR